MNKLVSKEYYEVFEKHTTNRGVYILTLRINKENAVQEYQYKDRKIPIGTLTTVISETTDAPDKASFLIVKNIGWNKERVSITKSFRTIHNRVDAIKDAINYPNLRLIFNGKDIPPYKMGVFYENKGLYQGIRESKVLGEIEKYHLFTNNGEYVEKINT